MQETVDQSLLTSALNYAQYLRKHIKHPMHHILFKYLSMINVDIVCIIMLILFFPHPHVCTRYLHIALVVFIILSAIGIAHATTDKTAFDLFAYPRITLNSNMTAEQKNNITQLFYVAQRTKKREQAENILASNFTYNSCVAKLLRLIKLDVLKFKNTHND